MVSKTSLCCKTDVDSTATRAACRFVLIIHHPEKMSRDARCHDEPRTIRENICASARAQSAQQAQRKAKRGRRSAARYAAMLI